MFYLFRSLAFARKHGFRSLFVTAPWYAYQHIIRPRLPRKSKVVEYNGVKVRPYRIGDTIVPFEIPPNQGGHPNPSEYEAELVAQTESRVRPTDTVIVIGGGLGVSTVTAARRAQDGEVIVYEAAHDLAQILIETMTRNGVSERVTVKHAIVGEDVKIEGPPRGAPIIEPAELPECDVLIMDCEGAELEILHDLKIRPRELVVETHGNRNQIEEMLAEIGYCIESSRVAERPPLASQLRENGIYVLGATC